MNIALIAHDLKKVDMIGFAMNYKEILSKHTLYATGTTGFKVAQATGLEVNCKKSGPLGGDQEIGSMVANGLIDVVIFMRDPLSSQPHEPDVNALLRLCDVYSVPLATNRATAKLVIDTL